jgi:hypothetical protein
LEKNPTEYAGTFPVELLSKLNNLELEMPQLLDHNMPLKGGSNLHCSIVNPLLYFKDSEQRALAICNYLESFESTSIEVLVKRQNTMKFLKKADDRCQEFDGKDIEISMLAKQFGI